MYCKSIQRSINRAVGATGGANDSIKVNKKQCRIFVAYVLAVFQLTMNGASSKRQVLGGNRKICLHTVTFWKYTVGNYTQFWFSKLLDPSFFTFMLLNPKLTRLPRALTNFLTCVVFLIFSCSEKRPSLGSSFSSFQVPTQRDPGLRLRKRSESEDRDEESKENVGSRAGSD